MTGDAEQLRSLHAATYPDLLRFVKRRVPEDDADDIVSATFEVAWRRIAQLPEDARPWLFGIARNLMANQGRLRLRRSAVDVRMVADPDPAQADLAPGVDTRLDLVRAWWTLSAGDREVLALVAFDGLTDGQAATVLGCRPATFRMRLTRARQRLRTALAPATDDFSPAPLWSNS